MPQALINPAAPGAFSIYKNSALGLVLKYPAEWQANESLTPISFGLVFLAPMEDPPSPFRENVLFTIQPLLVPLSVEEYVQFGVHQAQGQIQLLSSAPAALAGIPAQQLIYSGSLNPQFQMPGKVLSLVATRENRGYMLSYTARTQRFDYYLPFVEQMIASIDIL